MSIREKYENNDIIYETPPNDWWNGWIVGNGSGGAVIWNPEEEVVLQLGHTDLLDRTPDTSADGRMIPNTRHNLRGALRIHGVPLFSPYYLKEYYARTGLADGIVNMAGESEFGSFSLQFFYSKEPGVFVLRYTDSAKEPLLRSFHLEKLGSRFFSRIWTGTARDTSMGVGATLLKTEGDIIELTHEKGAFKMADVVKLKANTCYRDVQNNHSLERIYEPVQEFSLELRVCLGFEKPLDECLEMARAIFADCERYSFEELQEKKRKEYEKELPDTYITLPQDPYYENLWYASRYHMRSCYQGKYPAFFINGPFGGDRDKREWSDCWLHWNMHDSHLGIIKNGDWDLFHAFAEYKMRQIPTAIELARREYGCGGMVTQDQQTPDGGHRGISEDYYKLQIYPCLHTSLLFYQYWQFTGDKNFLKEKLYPYISLTLEFWRDYLVEREGKYHIPRSNPYEFHNGYSFEDCLTNLSLLRACLEIYEEVESAVGEETKLRVWCEEAGQKLADFTSIPVFADYVTKWENGRRIYDNPFFYGEEYRPEDEVFAVGFSERVKAYVTHNHTHAEIEEPDVKTRGGCGAFCSSQTAFIFPALAVSSDASPEWRERCKVSDRERKMWENGRNALRTIRRYPGRQAGDFPIEFEKTLSWTGHSLELPAFARLGLKEPLRKALEFYTHNYQMFPQGMFNYHPRSRWTLSYQDYTRDDGKEIRIYFDRLCKHFSLEELGVYTETIDIMLLESAHGVIRLFQCYDRDGAFKLPAQGGFLVETLQKDGEIPYIRVNSKLGKRCSVRTAWEHCWLMRDGGAEELPIEHAVVSFETKAGETYLLSPTENPDLSLAVEQHSAQPFKNKDVTLGLFPSF